MPNKLDADAPDQLLRTARTHNASTARRVTEQQRRELHGHDLVKT